MINRQVNYIIKEGQQKLEAAGKESSAFDARALLSFVTGMPFSQMPLHYGDVVTDEQQARYHELLERRINGEPLQYITGEQEFMGLTFHVDPRVLIPRLDTEILAEDALEYVNSRLTGRAVGIRLLDLCCGSGALGLSVTSLAGEPGRLEVVLADISQDALDVARQNAEALGVLDRVSFVKSDLFDAFSAQNSAECRGGAESSKECAAGSVQGDFDLIVCNPPYVRSDVIPTLDEEVRGHEPMLALDGGPDGLDIYRRIAKEAPDHLKNGGRLMMEIGFDQAEDVAELLRQDFDDVQVKKDLAGLDRVISAALK